MYIFMNFLIQFFEFSALAVEIVSLVILVIGFLRGALGWFSEELKQTPWNERFSRIRSLRCNVGIHILFALELMIISDLIHSFLAVVRSDSYENFFSSDVFLSLVQLGMVVVIRTLIDIVLSKEIDGIEK